MEGYRICHQRESNISSFWLRVERRELLGQHANRLLTPYFIWGVEYKIYLTVFKLLLQKKKKAITSNLLLQFSRSVVSNSLQPHWLQHARLPCPSPAPGACSKSCPLSWWCHPTIPSSVVPFFLLPSIFPRIRAFSNESVLIRCPKFQSFSFSSSPSDEYSGLIYFMIDWIDLLAVQGTLKSLLQYYCSKASILLSALWSNSYIHTQLLEKP